MTIHYRTFIYWYFLVHPLETGNNVLMDPLEQINFLVVFSV